MRDTRAKNRDVPPKAGQVATLIEAYRKANRMLELVNRIIVYPDPVVLVRLYQSLARPHLEYCALASMEPSLSEGQGSIGKTAAPFHQIVPRAKIAELHRQAEKVTAVDS